ncbi:MAG: DEAD/DEAH box helicase family protein [Bdellovibrionales bacterium]|nr:DEAD/DEAH box helicase family protein [Bdellovibrionales bacterium]
MNIDTKKLERQLIGVNKWRHSKDYGANKNGVGTLNYCTGVGKTYTALLIVKNYLEKDNTKFIQIIVPSEQLYKDWKKEISKHIPIDLQDRIAVSTIHQILVDSIVIICDLVIIDEIHEFTGDERIKVISGELCIYKHILALTATWDKKCKENKILNDKCPVIDIISEYDAITEGYVSPCIEYNLGLRLDEYDQKDYRDFSKVINDNLNKFGSKGFEAAYKVLSGGEFQGKHYPGIAYATMWANKNGWRKDLDYTIEENRKINEIWNPNKIIGYASNLMEAVRVRKNLLYNASPKAEAAIEIIKRFPYLKTICFGQSTAFVDKLNLLINEKFGKLTSVAYHSRLPSSTLPDDDGNIITIKTGKNKGQPKIFGAKGLKEFAIKAIRTGKVKVIVTATALDKGFDVEDIELGVVAARTSNPTQQIQRRGRVKRLKLYKLDTIVIIVNLYIKDTKDEDWLRDSQKGSPNMIHWIDNIEQIKHKFVPPESDVEI